MSDWREQYGDQNLRMAQKMLEQQGEVNDLRKRAEQAERQSYRRWIAWQNASRRRRKLRAMAAAAISGLGDANALARRQRVRAEQAEAELTRLRAAEKRVRDLHSPEEGQHPDFCWHDKHEMPCPTIAALDQAPAEEANET